MTNLAFEQVFGSTFTDEDDIAHVARWAAREGFAVLPVHPGTKRPLCPLSDAQKRKLDREAEQAARDAGKRHWHNARHECGVHHAMTNPDQAHRAFTRLAKRYPGLNIGLEVGASKLVCVDCDQEDDVERFAALWAEESDDPELVHANPTVTSPGVYRGDTGEWVHKGGGHFWFTLPDGMDFSEAATAAGFKLPDAAGAQVYFKDRLILVPPSVREEGAYEFRARPTDIPAWLLARIEMHLSAHLYRREKHRERVEGGDDPVTEWAAEIPWSVLLEYDGWSRGSGSFSDCGCEEWTAPGPHDHAKSATAHEAGCEMRDTEDGILHVWTDNPPEPIATVWEREGRVDISKFRYVTWRDYEGNYARAARALGIRSSEGYSAAVEDELAELAGDAYEGHGERHSGSQSDSEDDAEDEEEAESQLADLLGHSGTHSDTEVDEAFAAAVERVLRGRRIKRAADIAEAAELRPDPAQAWSLTELLAASLDKPKYLVNELWPYGGNLQLTAQYKSGKTHAAMNMVAALVDQHSFLDRFRAELEEGKVLVIDTEMTEAYLQEWWAAMNIEHPERVQILSMRGREARLDFRDPELRAEWTRWCIDHEIRCVVLDCVGPVWSSLGIEENSNTETGAWVGAFRAFTVEAGIEAGSLLVHHTGRDGSHSRGASRLNDWNDAELLIRKATDGDGEADMDGPRYYSAFGRDVHVTEFAVCVEDHVLYVDDDAPSRREQTERARADATNGRVDSKIIRIVEYLGQYPGASSRDILEAMGGRAEETRKAVKRGIAEGLIRTEDGPRNAKLHYSETPGVDQLSREEGDQL